jgi:hypothetical protein
MLQSRADQFARFGTPISHVANIQRQNIPNTQNEFENQGKYSILIGASPIYYI